jgi:lipopolysaccharide/colanic/teichoic acid biosynthesis glycosyltransferase
MMHRLAKRSLDLGAAAVALILLAPILAIVAATIRLTMGPPVLFRQVRVGWQERPFRIAKFRTMNDSRDASGGLLPDSQRLTFLGRFMRALSIDELPQLANVFVGEMSLVGPRPLLPEYLPRYNRCQRRRHEVKPGITGWAQVNGRNGLTWEQKFELDVWYVDHCSIWLDLKVLWMTVLQVLRRDGISQAGHATMPEFLGTPTPSRRDE